MLSRSALVGTWLFIVSLLVACGVNSADKGNQSEEYGQVAQAVTGPPTVTSFLPVSAAQGASVNVVGTQFEPGVSVSFNDTPSATVTFLNATKVKAVVPAGATSGPISVTNSMGTGASAGSFAVLPKVVSFSPGLEFPGGTVTILGGGFTGATAVKFGTYNAAFSVVNDATITATVPAGPTTVKISVVTPQGTSISTGTIIVAPIITSFSPAYGAVGTSVTILGAGFTTATSVLFSTTAATFTVVNDTQIDATVPPNALSGKITVVTPSGSRVSAVSFGVLELPVITSFTPTTAVLPATIAIKGDGFIGTTGVRIGQTMLSFTVLNKKNITATVPVGVAANFIRVTNPLGNTLSAVQFIPDPDECALGTDNCDPNAICTNTLGSFSCACPSDMTGDGVNCDCNLTGTFAVRTEFDVEWDATTFLGATIISAGTATTESWSIREQTHTGTTLDVDMVACGGTAADLCSPFYSQAFAQTLGDIWQGPNMPVSQSTMMLTNPDPGDPFVGPQEVALLGLDLSSPAGPWPTPWNNAAITWMDHDSDGFLGVTSTMTTTGNSTSCGGLPYANLPDPTNPLGSPRVAKVYLGTRSLGTFSGTLTSCSLIEGTVTGPVNGFPSADGHVTGCLLSNGGSCSNAQINALDNQVQTTGRRTTASHFTMVRVADGISCADVRGMTFP